MPDLLLLSQRLPYPPNKGEKIRYLQILKYLAQWYDIYPVHARTRKSESDKAALMLKFSASVFRVLA